MAKYFLICMFCSAVYNIRAQNFISLYQNTNHAFDSIVEFNNKFLHVHYESGKKEKGKEINYFSPPIYPVSYDTYIYNDKIIEYECIYYKTDTICRKYIKTLNKCYIYSYRTSNFIFSNRKECKYPIVIDSYNQKILLFKFKLRRDETDEYYYLKKYLNKVIDRKYYAMVNSGLIKDNSFDLKLNFIDKHWRTTGYINVERVYTNLKNITDVIFQHGLYNHRIGDKPYVEIDRNKKNSKRMCK